MEYTAFEQYLQLILEEINVLWFVMVMGTTEKGILEISYGKDSSFSNDYRWKALLGNNDVTKSMPRTIEYFRNQNFCND